MSPEHYCLLLQHKLHSFEHWIEFLRFLSRHLFCFLGFSNTCIWNIYFTLEKSFTKSSQSSNSPISLLAIEKAISPNPAILHHALSFTPVVADTAVPDKVEVGLRWLHFLGACMLLSGLLGTKELLLDFTGNFIWKERSAISSVLHCCRLPCWFCQLSCRFSL